jgi:hypothetical protein
VAGDFWNDLTVGIPSKQGVRDVIITGSSAAYGWSSYSDVDLHLVVDLSGFGVQEELMSRYFNALKNLWNNHHRVMIGEHEVEVYVQDLDEPHHASGVFSLTNNEWIRKPAAPVPGTVRINKHALKKKLEVVHRLMDELRGLLNLPSSSSPAGPREAIELAEALSTRLKRMRSCGLESGGEWSVENLLYKYLRRIGILSELRELRFRAYDELVSVKDVTHR